MRWQDSLSRFLGLDRILALVGIILAVCALIITFYQVHLMHAQAKIAVWPHVEQTTTYYDRNPYPPFQGDPLFKYVVTNTGVGPATVRYLDVKFDGRTLHGGDWTPVMRLLAMPSKEQTSSAPQSLDILKGSMPPGTVLLQGETQTLFEIIKNGAAEANRHRHRLAITICYCSLYGDCWISRSGKTVDSRVSNCPNGRASGFYTGKFSAPMAATAGPG